MIGRPEVLLAVLASTVEMPMLRETDNSPKGFVNAVKPSKKIFRNQPCPCGSGKKSKRCCKGVVIVKSDGDIPERDE